MTHVGGAHLRWNGPDRRAHLATVLDSSEKALKIFDAKGIVLYGNRARQIRDRARQELQPSSWRQHPSNPVQ